MRGVWYVCGILLWLPYTTHGAVLINEIAWKGTATNANDEWIELYNDGADNISLDGWAIYAKSYETDAEYKILVKLKGALSHGNFTVLKSTYGDGEIKDVSDNVLSYTQRMTNEGLTLTLCRESGALSCVPEAIEDQVAGGEQWKHMGVNTNYDTAQRTLENGWITSTPTPNAQNETRAVESAQDSETNIDTNNSEDSLPANTTSSGGIVKSKHSPTQTIRLKEGEHELVLAVTIPDTIYEKQGTQFMVEPSGTGKTVLNSLRYVWNFGDMSTSTQKNPTHIYDFPGTYILVLEAGFAKQHALLEKQITVLPVTLSLSRDRDGNVLVQNDAPYVLDVSGYTLRGARSLVFPDRTKIAPNGSIAIHKDWLGVEGLDQYVYAYDARGQFITSTIPDTEKYVVLDTPQSRKTETFSYTQTEPDSEVYSHIATSSNTNGTQTSEEYIRIEPRNEDENTSQEEKYTYAVIALALLIGIVGYIRRR